MCGWVGGWGGGHRRGSGGWLVTPPPPPPPHTHAHLPSPRLAARLAALGRAGTPEVAVLAHGWRRFSMQFGDDEELVEQPLPPRL